MNRDDFVTLIILSMTVVLTLVVGIFLALVPNPL